LTERRQGKETTNETQRVPEDGGRQPPRPEALEEGRGLGGNGFYMFGDKGTFLSGGEYCQSPRLIPESAMKVFAPNRPEETIPRVPGGNQWQEWIRTCKGEGPKPGEYAWYRLEVTKNHGMDSSQIGELELL